MTKTGQRGKKSEKIDWEQRRYEIAKDFYIQTCQQAKVDYNNSPANVFKSVALLSVVVADYLIGVLKK